MHDWGGDGAPVLLAHPTGFHGRVWAPVAERLVARGPHASGRSTSAATATATRPTSDYSWHGFADDVLAVAEHLGVAGDPDAPRVRPLEGRRGARARRAEAARHVPRIWAYEPIIFPTRDRAAAAARTSPWRARRASAATSGTSIDEAFAAYASKPPLNVMTRESLRAYVDYGLRDRGDGVFELKCRPEVEAQRLHDGPEPRRVRAARRSRAPTCSSCAARRRPTSARRSRGRSPNASRTAASR